MSGSPVTGLGIVGPEQPPAAVVDTRAELAAELLSGSGIEIGALNCPLTVPPQATVTYVDRMTVEDLRAHYRELADADLTPVDVIDDGERLETFADESVDFVVANHFLEHCEDPIGTIETHLSKLRPGGVLFYAVPDKRYTFDFRRPRTPLAHVVHDYEHGPQSSRHDHYVEWERLVYPAGAPSPGEDDARRRPAEHEAANYSIHFHVWTQADLLELLLHCQERFGTFEIEAVRRRGLENIVVLRKHGELEPVPQPVMGSVVAKPDADDQQETAPEPSAVHSMPTSAARTHAMPTSAARIRLSALRATLDAGSAAAKWPVDLDGVPGRALELPAGAALRFPLRLGGPVRLATRVMLPPHDWRDLRGAVRAWIAVTEGDGARRELWSGRLSCSDDGGLPDGLGVECELPASTSALLLGSDPQPPCEGPPVGRAMWLGAEIDDASERTPAAPRHQPESNGSPADGPNRSSGPLISVLTPVHDPPPGLLEAALSSVRTQSFADWELCLVDDGSRDPEVVETLRRHAAADERIHLVRREQAGGIATATNAALEIASGEYIALLDHDDELEPHALELVAQKIQADPDLDMIYSDEDVIADGRPIWSHLKPDWSPESFNSMMYTCHLGVYRRAIALELGGFRHEFDGSQDYDFVLRLIERTDRIAHIPHILYHWRAHSRSAAGSDDAKPFAYGVARRAIAEHLERTGRFADVQFGIKPGLYRVVQTVDPSLSVALVIAPTAAHWPPEAITDAARSWLSQPHRTWQIVLAASPDALPNYTAWLRAAGINATRITVVPTDPAADQPTALSSAAAATQADYLVLMQSPVIGLTHDWLRRLLSYCTDTAIAAAGPIVLAPDGRITHAGVAITDGIPLFLMHGFDGTQHGPLGWGTAVFNVSAVSGVIATRREIFDSLHGLRSEMGHLALIDYCLRASRSGKRTVTIPDARLRTIGPDHATNDLTAIRQLRQAWRAALPHDPYYNPNYRQDRGDFTPQA
jgi:GT2 family glycosyltransferase/SAM-dependent methyltransferase